MHVICIALEMNYWQSALVGKISIQESGLDAACTIALKAAMLAKVVLHKVS